MDLLYGYLNFKNIRIQIIIRIRIRIRIIIRIRIRIRFQIENRIRIRIRQKIIRINICIRKYRYPLLSEYVSEYDQIISDLFAPLYATVGLGQKQRNKSRMKTKKASQGTETKK
jgi:hypothetical protein